MSKISNVITLLELLANGKKYKVKDLASLLEVSPRMIRSYKEELEKAGIYIDSIMGPYGGYILKKEVNLPNRSFIKEDYEIIDLCIKKTKNQKERVSLENLKDKIRNLYIVRSNRQKGLKIQESMKEKYNILTKAIEERRKVKITYYSFDKGETERIIYPGEMYCFQENWYCSAYCELRQDIRHFDLKRITKIILLEEIY